MSHEHFFVRFPAIYRVLADALMSEAAWAGWNDGTTATVDTVGQLRDCISGLGFAPATVG
jgi:hypothetical protein